MTVVVRKYRDGDLEAIVALINEADAVDHLDEATDASTLRELLYRPDLDPYHDVLVALEKKQSVAGYARLELKDAPLQGRFYAHTVVHPDWRGEPIERLLLEKLWSRAEERRQILTGKPAQFPTYCAAHQVERISLFESLGLGPVRYDLHMVCHPLDNLPDPAFPPGIRVRPYAKGEDDESAVEVVNLAFSDVMDFAAVSLQDFTHWISSPPFRDDLSYVALDLQKVVGLCLCTVIEAQAALLGRAGGTIDSFCVRPEYRRRGLGLALLLTSLQAFRRAGLESATLDADTANPTEAIGLYQKAGFREVWRWVTYGRDLT